MAEQTGEQVAMSAPPVVTRWGTGFFVNQAGDVVTARHVIAGCDAVSIMKDGHSAPAIVSNAGGGNFDIAVLHSAMKPPVAAVFAKTVALERGEPVFAESYAVLRRMTDARTTLFNGFLHASASADADHIAISSQAGHGSSGSPVLDTDGLVIGLIDERVSVRGAAIGGTGASAADSFVIALSGKAIKSFLAASGVAFAESAEAELDPLQGHAVEAAAISVAVICH